MNRQQFAEAIKKINTKPYRININTPSDGALQRGCYLEDGKWKAYETNRRGRLRVLFRSSSEEKAFSYLYEVLTKTEKPVKRRWFPFRMR